MLPRILRCALLSASMALAAASASAGDIDYVFTLDWQSGPLTGTSSSGSLSFDESLAAPNAEYFSASLSAFSLVVGSTAYGLADVGIGFLTFDANADLRLLGVGTSCGPGFCSISPGDPPGLMVVYDSQSQLDRFSGYLWPANADQSFANGTFAVAAVPEPSAMALLLAGGGLLAWRRRALRRPGSGAIRAACQSGVAPRRPPAGRRRTERRSQAREPQSRTG